VATGEPLRLSTLNPTRGSLRGSVRGIECYPAEQEAGENEGEIVVGEDGDLPPFRGYVGVIRGGYSILTLSATWIVNGDEGLGVQEVPNFRCHYPDGTLADSLRLARKPEEGEE